MPDIESTGAILLLWAILGYVLGSIPFGLLIAQGLGLGNLRNIGSGNIGATNVLRTGSRGAAAATLLLDAAKGAVAVLMARWMAGADAAQLAGLTAFLGHCFPVWLGFRGGKGVATFLGIMLAVAWPAGIACCLTWLATAALGRISSLAALVAAAWSPLVCLLVGHGVVVALSLCLAALIVWRHRG